MGHATTDQACRHFTRGRCSGCTRLPQPYPAQLAVKGDYVRAMLADVLAADGATLHPVTASPRPMGYRSSVKLCLSGDREGRVAAGLYQVGSKTVVPTTGCPAQTDEVNRLVAQLLGTGGSRDQRRGPAAAGAAYAGSPPGRQARGGRAAPGARGRSDRPGARRGPAFRLPPFYNHRSRVFQKGRVKFLTIRAAPGGDLAIILSHTGVAKPVLTAWLEAAGLAGLCAYESWLTPADGDLPVGRHVAHLSGPAHFRFALAGRTFGLAPTSFFQANNALAPALVAAAIDFAAPGDVLLDLYGGFGAYSFAAAPRFARRIVVDGNAAAIDAAQRAAATGGDDLTAVATFCEPFLADAGAGLAPADRARVTHVLVNPPRGGLSRRVVTELSQERLPRAAELHYVSCNPETLARDAAALRAHGWRLRDAKPFDMFPQTDHVEVVARFFMPASHAAR